MTYTAEQSGTIKWTEVISLVFLNVAVHISWLAYYEYSPELLSAFSLEHYVGPLYWAKLIALVVVPALAGFALDRFIKVSQRALLVGTLGVIFTGIIFMMVTSTMVVGAGTVLASALPILIVLWLLGMNVFVAPAHSYLREFSALDKLPIAMAVIVFTADVIYALESVIVDFIVWMGPVVTFSVGGGSVLFSGLLFQYFVRNEAEERQAQELVDEGTQDMKVVFSALFIGLVVGICHAVILHLYPFLLGHDQHEFFGLPDSFFPAAMFGLSALLAFVASRFVMVVEPAPSYITGVVLLMLSIVVLFFGQSFGFIMISGIICSAAFSLLSVAALPYLFARTNIRALGLVTGIYLGFTELADAAIELLQAIS